MIEDSPCEADHTNAGVGTGNPVTLPYTRPLSDAVMMLRESELPPFGNRCHETRPDALATSATDTTPANHPFRRTPRTLDVIGKTPDYPEQNHSRKQYTPKGVILQDCRCGLDLKLAPHQHLRRHEQDPPDQIRIRCSLDSQVAFRATKGCQWHAAIQLEGRGSPIHTPQSVQGPSL
jgi:hypothetical protein